MRLDDMDTSDVEVDDRTAQGAGGDAGALDSVGGDTCEPGARACDGLGGQHPEIVERLLLQMQSGAYS